MASPAKPPQHSVRFGVFELDLRTRELRGKRRKLTLQEQPFLVLTLLLESPGQLVTRDELMKRIWSSDTFVDFDHSLNKAVNRLRDALGDSAEQPRFIETLPRLGYRFIASVTDDGPGDSATAAESGSSGRVYEWPADSGTARSDAKKVDAHSSPQIPGVQRTLSYVPIGVAAVLVVALAAWFTSRQLTRRPGLPELKQWQLTTNSSENTVVSGAISPDAKYLAYADLEGIHIKLVATGETATVPQPESLKGAQVNWGIVPTWVRDGTRFIANANIPGQPSSIWAIPVLGGAPRKIRDDASAWTVSRDGSKVAFAQGPGEVWLMRPDGEEARKLYPDDANNGYLGAEFSPDGQRMAYYKFHEADNKFDYSIETRDLKGGPATTVVSREVNDFSWSPDGRMIYSLDEPGPASESCNFWGLAIDSRTGKLFEKPTRLTNWAGFCMDNPSVTADGKRLAFRRWSWQSYVYVADLEAEGTRITTPKRLTLNEGRNYPVAWTPDSKAVVFGSYRDTQWRILKQYLGEDATEPIANGAAGDAVIGGARVSPDGGWLLYFAPLNEASSPVDVTVRLMRVPITGGPAQPVLQARIPTYGALNDPMCANSPAVSCVIVEQTPDRKQLIFTAFDPMKGRGRELARHDMDNDHAYGWDLSPDGARIAVFKYSEGRIHILHTDGQASQAIAVKGWSSLQSVHWAADGKGVFVSSATPSGAALIHVDLKGNPHVLWEQKGSIAPWGGPWDMAMGAPSAPWAVPSPDGRHLAIYSASLSANMWMMENF